MLGKRSRPTHTKFPPMSPENRDCSAPSKSNGFFNNPRLLIGFNSKIGEGEGGARSPTSTLDAKVFSDYKPCRSPRGGFENPASRRVGLGILAALHTDNTVTTYCKTTFLSPRSSETRIPAKTQPIAISTGPTRPPSEQQVGMEYSESYTCITSHGPMPTIRQIFNDPVEDEKRNRKCCKPAVFETAASPLNYPSFTAADFLSVCYLCHRQLRHGKDIYMYRGDKAFCSVECRNEQIVSDEEERCASRKGVPSCWPNIFTTGTMAAA